MVEHGFGSSVGSFCLRLWPAAVHVPQQSHAIFARQLAIARPISSGKRGHSSFWRRQPSRGALVFRDQKMNLPFFAGPAFPRRRHDRALASRKMGTGPVSLTARRGPVFAVAGNLAAQSVFPYTAHQMDAEGMQFSRRLNRSTISANLELFWGKVS